MTGEMDGENNYTLREFREELRAARKEMKTARTEHDREYLKVHISILEDQIARRRAGITRYDPDPES